MDLTAAPERQEVRVLCLISSGHFMSHLFSLSMPPLFIYLKVDFGVSFAALGLLLSVRSIASGTCQVPMGFLVDRVGARPMLTAGLLIIAASVALMATADSYWILAGLFVLAGLGNSVFHPSDYSILSSSINSSWMGRAFSIHTFAGHLGMALAPIVIVALAEFWGWRVALLVVAAAGAVVVAGLATQWNLLHDDALPKKASKTSSDADAQPLTFKENVAVLSSKPMLILFAFYLMTSLSGSGIRAFLVVALVALHDTPLVAASGALTGYLFASAFGVLLGGVIADKTSRHDIVAAAAFLFTALVILLLGVVALNTLILVFLMTLAGLSQGIIRPSRDMMVRAITPKGSTGKAFGFVSSSAAIGGAVAPVMYGWLLDIGRPEWVFYALAFFIAGSVATALVPKGTVGRD